MLSSQNFLTTSLREHRWGETVAQVLAAAVAAVDPAAAVRTALERTGATLRIGTSYYQLDQYERVFVVGMGKAGAPMASAAAAALGDYLNGGVVVVKHGHAHVPEPIRVEIREAGHPVPDADSVAGAQKIAALLNGVTVRDLVLVLVSGGGSALLTLPAPGVSLADMQALTALLLSCGVTINEINTLRKHLDLVKGGGVARMAQPATVAALVLSDVIGNPLDIIASGPTVPDGSTFADAWAVLERYGLTASVPESIRAHFQRGLRGDVPETPKAGDALFAQVRTLVVGSNTQAALAAAAAAERAEFNTLLLTTSLQGEAREVAHVLAAILREVATANRPLQRPACIIAGGETTVTLRGNGRGGRNQELALAAASDLHGLDAVALVALATDGGDGPTDAAGAVVTGETKQRAALLGLDPSAYLARNNAYEFFASLGDLLQPGPTQTNVNDLVFLWAFPLDNDITP